MMKAGIDASLDQFLPFVVVVVVDDDDDDPLHLLSVLYVVVLFYR